MVNILIVTHGFMGKAMFDTAKDILGDMSCVEVYGISRGKSLQQLIEEFDAIIENYEETDSILILTDMPGGTPTNISLGYLKKQNIEILTGINLPMLITAVSKRNKVNNARELADTVSEEKNRSIIDCRSRMNV